MLSSIFGCKHSTEGKSLTRVGIVSDSNHICWRIIADAMDAWHLTTTNVINAGCLMQSPLVLTVQTLHYLLSKGDCRA